MHVDLAFSDALLVLSDYKVVNRQSDSQHMVLFESSWTLLSDIYMMPSVLKYPAKDIAIGCISYCLHLLNKKPLNDCNTKMDPKGFYISVYY